MKKSIHILFFILCFLLFSNFLFSQTPKYWMNYRYPKIVVNNKLWIGTEKGLFQYHYEDDVWSVFNELNGLCSNDVRLLFWDGQYLWVATSKGLSCADIKLNKWIKYTTGNGLPGDTIYSIAKQDDYIWVGTNRGAARFDKLIEEWETFSVNEGMPDSVVYDIVTEGNVVYLATAKGLVEYNHDFEKWRYYGVQDGILSDTIRFIYPTSEFLWLFTDKGPSRFSKKLHSTISFSGDPRLTYSMIHDLIPENDKFWIAGQQGVMIYDPVSNIWREFTENNGLPSQNVTTMNIGQSFSWFITSGGVSSFDNVSRNWQFYDRSRGLSSDRYEAVTEFMGNVFLIGEHSIDYLKTAENRWYYYFLQDVTEAKSLRKVHFSIDRDKGSYLKYDPYAKFDISSSRYAMRLIHKYDHYLNTGSTTTSLENIQRGDVKAQLSFPGNRSINGFYNNIDYVDKVMYGLRYKGNEKDYVQELRWGDVHYEQGKKNIHHSLGLLGYSGQLEFGKKTEKYKRSLFAVNGAGGKQNTGYEVDFLTGNYQEHQTIVLDKNYLKNMYFQCDTNNQYIPFLDGTTTIYMDDGSTLSNTENTLIGYKVAGIQGDFDVLEPLAQYILDIRKGVVQFLRPVNDSSIVIIRGKNIYGDEASIILKDKKTINNRQYNRYFLGGVEIIPSTLVITITDSMGKEYSLSSFGLDNDGNQLVDPEYLDYKKGILSFPSRKPFPADIYLTGSVSNHFRIKITFQSEISIFTLSHKNLVRGSEQVIVDGELLKPGQDYVLDFTSGTLLIIKQGVIAEDSEIEVQYEFFREAEDPFYTGNLVISPSDHIQTEISYFHFTSPEADSSLQYTQCADIFNEWKWKIKKVDVKLSPEIAYSETGKEKGFGMNFRSDISAEKIRLFTTYEKYDTGFYSPYPKRVRNGELSEQVTAGATVFPLRFLELSTGWIQNYTQPRVLNNRSKFEDMNGKVVFSKNLFPALSFSARRRTQDTLFFKSDKMIYKADIEYPLPSGLLKTLSIKSLNLYGVWRKSFEERKPFSDSIHILYKNRIMDNQYFRFDFSPRDMIQFNAYYQGNLVRTSDTLISGNPQPLNHLQKIILNSTVDCINGLNIIIRFEDKINRNYPVSVFNTYSLNRRKTFQSEMKIFPGRWISQLSAFTFTVGYNPVTTEYFRNREQQTGLIKNISGQTKQEQPDFFETSKMYLFRTEWRLSSKLIIYHSMEHYDINLRNISSKSERTILRLFPKIEYKPAMNSVFTLLYNMNRELQPGYSTYIIHNPIFMVDNRWTERLQTKWNFTYRRENTITGNIDEYSDNYAPMLGITYRFLKKGTGASKVEIRNDISCSFFRSYKTSYDLFTNTYSNALSLDVFPVSVIVVRFRIVATYREDLLKSENNLFSTIGEIKITAQF